MKLIQDGPRKTRIVIVGEAPGKTEMATGIPFTGGSGHLLDKALSAAGISRNTCFLTNVCHIQPKGKKLNDFGWFFTKEGQPFLMHGLLQLKADLEEIRPNLVIALGAMPLRALTGNIGIDKWRGSILPCSLVPGLKVIATYHPAFILRAWDYKAILDIDLVRCRGDAEFPDLRWPDRTIYMPSNLVARRRNNVWSVDQESYDREEIIQQMLAAPWISQDIETGQDADGERIYLTCCGFSDSPDRALVLPANGAKDYEDIARLSGCAAQKIMQNAQYELTVLPKYNGIKVSGIGEFRPDGSVTGWDTMLAQHALYPECAAGEDEFSNDKKTKKKAAIRKGLGFLNSINTREPYYKDDGKIWKDTGDLPLFWRYNGLDCCSTFAVKISQENDLREFGTFGTFQHEMQLLPTLLTVTERGVPVDQKARSKLKGELEIELSNLQLFLDAGAGRPINVNSNGVNGDIGKLLYQQLGLPVKLHKKTNNPTADKDAIIELAAKYGHPLLLTILSIRERRKILETYLDAKLDSDGRLRCSYDPTGTNTGRLASRSTIWGTGQNLQNQPDKIRRTFIPERGYVFIQPDYSQAEARVVAYLAREKKMIEIFNDPTRDFHRENAAQAYHKALETVTYEERYTFKRVIHAYDYGQGAYGAMVVINQDAKDTWGKPGTHITVTLSQTQFIVEQISLMFPNIRQIFWYDTVQQLKRDRTLTGVFGRKRTFFGRWDNDNESSFLNAAYAYVPQNAVGELTTRAMVRVEHDYSDKVSLLGNTHDSMLLTCPDDEASISAAIAGVQECMDIPLTIHGQTFRIPSEFQIGYNWGKAGKDNPLGLTSFEKHLARKRTTLSVGG